MRPDSSSNVKQQKKAIRVHDITLNRLTAEVPTGGNRKNHDEMKLEHEIHWVSK